MLDYFKAICQIKKMLIFVVISIFLINSCSLPEKRHYVDKIPAKPVWFNTDLKFSERTNDHKVMAHPFFDLVPFSSLKTNMVNFVVLTPEGSKKKFDIDLYSGKIYKKFHLCKQDDVWDNYSGSIFTANFAEGFIPRLIDHAGLPQKIIVFGARNTYKRSRSTSIGSYRVRVIGGVVEQMCEKYPCLQKNEWTGRIVLVAVDPTYEKFMNVVNLYDLKQLVNWKYTLAYLANSSGRTFDRGLELPYIRVVDQIDAGEALSFAVKKGYLYKFKDIMKLRNSCHDLYGYIWDKINELRLMNKKLSDEKWIDKVVKNYLKKEAVKKRISTQEIVKLRKNVIEQRIKEISKDSFPIFFRHFYKNFKDKFSTCIAHVKSSNVQEDIKRHWFFAYLEGFFRVHSLGYIYNCHKREWFKNYRTTNGRWALDQQDELDVCTTSALDKAFVKIPELFSRLMNRTNDQYYKYLTYDFHDGSHEKLYSWIKISSKKISCDKEPDSIWKRMQGVFIKDQRNITFEEAEYVFPEDVAWEEFLNIRYEKLNTF